MADKKPTKGSQPKVRGFKNNAQKIAQRQGISVERASRILAGRTQKASAAAKKANPRLKKVPTKGSKRQAGGTFKK